LHAEVANDEKNLLYHGREDSTDRGVDPGVEVLTPENM